MKRLFMVAGFAFEHKAHAAKFRDDLNAGKPAVYDGVIEAVKRTGGTPFTIHLGPDHWRYGIEPASRRTHSHNMRAGGPGTGFKKRAK